MASSRILILKKFVIFNGILAIPIFASQMTDLQQKQMKRIKQLIFTDKLEYSQTTHQITPFSEQLEMVEQNEQIEIIYMGQKKTSSNNSNNNNIDEDEKRKSKKNKSEEEEGKQEEENEDDSDEESDSDDENDSDDDDDDNKNGGLLIPILEWVKGILPRIIPAPQSPS